MADHADPSASPPDGRRAVRRLAVARFASTGGSQAAQVALAYTVFERTGSAAWVSAALVACAGIVGVVGPLSGRLSDRFDRRRVMVIAEVGGAVGWLAVLLVDSPLALVATALFATAANAPFRAAASAAVPNLVPTDRLPWANSAMATAVNASLVVGPLVGGALVGSAGPRSVFAVNVATFLVSALVIARTPGSFSERDEAVVEGPTARWRDVAADGRRRKLFTVTALSFGAFGITLVADLPLVDHFGGGAVGYALLTTLWGLGAVAGSLVVGRLPERYERRSLIGGTAAMAIGLGSISVMPGLAAAIAVGTIGGVGSGMGFTPWYSLLQRCTPDAERGTAFAMAETFEQSSFIAGMVLAGVVVAPLGAQATYLLPGGLLLLATAVALRLAPTPTDAAALVPSAVTS